jgi:hypothetical protein
VPTQGLGSAVRRRDRAWNAEVTGRDRNCLLWLIASELAPVLAVVCRAELAGVAAVAPLFTATGELIPCPAIEPPEALPESPSAVDRFWLMSINCSRLFTCTS